MLRSVALILGIMAVAGWPSLSMPFRGDEALFAVVGRELAAGSVLYRDHWDVTNPGLFWFYQLAGSLFGFSEEGVRLLEWLWMTAFVLAASEASRRRSGATRLPLAPALFLGVAYYLAGYSATSILTKAEGLVGFPLFLATWFAARPVEGARHTPANLAVAGAAGGVVILFKLLLGGCVAVVWLYMGAEFIRGRSKLPAALRYAAGLTLGLLVVLGPAVGYFAAHGALDIVLRTLFELPPKFLAEGQTADLDRIAVSLKWFLGQYAAVLGAAVLGVGCLLRAGRDPFAIAVVLAGVASVGALLAQRLSWWPYHFLLPGGLAAVLAGHGWPAVAETVRGLLARPLTVGERVTGIAAAAVLLFEPLAAGGYQWVRLAGHGFGVTAESRRALRESMGGAYREAREETDWLSGADAKPGPVFVGGDPLFYWLSGRTPAVRISGWSLEIYPREVRLELADEVGRAAPVYVYVSANPLGYDRLIRDRYPELARLLAAEYAPVRATKLGVWYERGGDSGK